MTDASAAKQLDELRREVREVRDLLSALLRRDPDALVSAAQGAQLLGISKRTFWEYVSQGVLPLGRRIGSCRRWTRQEVLNAAQRVGSG